MPTQAPVTERAVLARINRRLAKERQAIKKCRRDSRSHETLGDFYLLDGGMITNTCINIEDFAREKNVMGAWERLAR